jgi:hypothetical protein
LFGDVQAAGGKFLIIRGLLGNKYVWSLVCTYFLHIMLGCHDTILLIIA